jgi:stearoyl-CoA desaturase (delta-9 desaturase)
MEAPAQDQPPTLAAEAAEVRTALDLPEEVQPLRMAWGYTLSIVLIHVLSLLALSPWYFSWTGVIIGFLGMPGYGLLGITLCYHRLLTHQGFTCPKWLEHTLALIGVCNLQDTPARWVAIHRLHHRHADRQPDPHSPLVNFFWSHMGWLMVEHREHSSIMLFEKYARDVLRDRFYLRLERNLAWLWIYMIHAGAYLVLGTLLGRVLFGDWLRGVQFGGSLLVWGVFVRTVAAWHCTWAVNSVSHIFGYRNYETHDDSRNQWFVAIVAHGEGWHNNHHADQRAAAHGHRWWEYDLTYVVIRLLEAVGLAKNVVRPRVWSGGRGGRIEHHANPPAAIPHAVIPPECEPASARPTTAAPKWRSAPAARH